MYYCNAVDCVTFQNEVLKVSTIKHDLNTVSSFKSTRRYILYDQTIYRIDRFQKVPFTNATVVQLW